MSALVHSCRRRKGVSDKPSRKRIFWNEAVLRVWQKVRILEQDAWIFGDKSRRSKHRWCAELLQAYTGFKLASAFVSRVNVQQLRQQNENGTLQHRILWRLV